MPAPILTAAIRLLAKKGTREAVKKYGKKAIDQIKKRKRPKFGKKSASADQDAAPKKESTNKTRAAKAKKAVAKAKGPVAKRRAQYDALKGNTKAAPKRKPAAKPKKKAYKSY